MSANALYRVSTGDTPKASDVDQILGALRGAIDIGSITFASVSTAPVTGGTATAAAGSGLGIGAYLYAVTYVTGVLKSDATLSVHGETLPNASFAVTTTSGNQQVGITAMPVSAEGTVIGKRLYRTVVGGAQLKLVTTLAANVTTYTDTTADASLGANVPSSATTGTSLAVAGLAAGTEGYVLKTVSGVAAWAAATGFANPMTTAGDLIYGGVSGAATRLAVGGANTAVVSNGTNPAWAAIVNSVAGTANQITVSGATGAVTFSLPQSIHTAATPTFAGLTLSGELAMTDQLVTRPELKDYAETISTNATSGAAATIDLVNGNHHKVTLTAACTLTFSNPPATGKLGSFTLRLIQGGTGSYTVTWPASVKWTGNTAPTLATTVGSYDVLTFFTEDAGTTWIGSHVGAVTA